MRRVEMPNGSAHRIEPDQRSPLGIRSSLCTSRLVWLLDGILEHRIRDLL